MQSTKRLSDAAPVAMRVALAAGFLSAVADRFGLWGPFGTPGVSWGGFARFLDYTATLLPYLPTTLVAVAGWGAAVARAGPGGALPPRGGRRPWPRPCWALHSSPACAFAWPRSPAESCFSPSPSP